MSQVFATRPERAEAPSPGHRPGLLWIQPCRPVRAKALKNQKFIRLLPLQGALLIAIIPRAMPWARSFCPFRACCFWSFWPSALSGRAASGAFGLLPFQGVLLLELLAFSPFLNRMRKFCKDVKLLTAFSKSFVLCRVLVRN